MHSAKRSLHHAVGAELTPLTPLPELAMPSSGSARRIVQIFLSLPQQKRSDLLIANIEAARFVARFVASWFALSASTGALAAGAIILEPKPVFESGGGRFYDSHAEAVADSLAVNPIITTL